MYQESEIVDLVMAVFLTPILFVVFRTVYLAGRRWFVSGYLAVIAGYVFTVVEGYFAPDLFNTLEHVSYAVGGVCFAVGAWSVLTSARRRSAS
ncbi:MAG: hypothetical protein Q7W16_08845 [Coriobacteriia bacterium]|nr:hypothetical protein [Coriobacteriia bacterium]